MEWNAENTEHLAMYVLTAVSKVHRLSITRLYTEIDEAYMLHELLG